MKFIDFLMIFKWFKSLSKEFKTYFNIFWFIISMEWEISWKTSVFWCKFNNFHYQQPGLLLISKKTNLFRSICLFNSQFNWYSLENCVYRENKWRFLMYTYRRNSNNNEHKSLIYIYLWTRARYHYSGVWWISERIYLMEHYVSFYHTYSVFLA